MQPWDYLVFVPVFGAGYYLWQRRKKKTSCGACSACPSSKGCAIKGDQSIGKAPKNQ